MHRTEILNRLARHSPANPIEAEHLRRITQFVQANADCFERSLAPGHITGSAWIVDRERTQALLLHHVKLDRWLQPGGHADGDPDVHAVALREAREETGLRSIHPLGDAIFDVDVHEFPARADVAAHFHYDIRFLFEADRLSLVTANHESKAVAWVPLHAMLRWDKESLARMARKVTQRHPERFVAG